MSGEHKEMLQKEVRKGCDKMRRAPWVVHRTTKDGHVVTRHRFPSDQERLRNRARERNRRLVARKIFSGLRTFGNYNLPKKANDIDLLKALCDEAGWHVEENGIIYKKMVKEDIDYRKCDEKNNTLESITKMANQEDLKINLKLSLTLGS